MTAAPTPVGFEVPADHEIPVEMCVKHLPAAEFAVFTMRGDQVGDDWHLDAWLAFVGYEQAYPLVVQRYDRRFLGMDRLDESELDFMVPVRTAGPRGHK